MNFNIERTVAAAIHEADRDERQALISEEITKTLKSNLESSTAVYAAAIQLNATLQTNLVASSELAARWDTLRKKYESERHNAFIAARQAENRANEALCAWDRQMYAFSRLQKSSSNATYSMNLEKSLVQKATMLLSEQEAISSEARKIADRSLATFNGFAGELEMADCNRESQNRRIDILFSSGIELTYFTSRSSHHRTTQFQYDSIAICRPPRANPHGSQVS